MKKIKISILGLALLMVLSSMSVMVFAAGEPDYSQWNSGAGYPADVMGTPLLAPVKSLMDRKILTGDSDGLIHPEKFITRAEFATIMAKAANLTGQMSTVQNKNIYNDLDGYSWAKGYINLCSQAKLIEGRGNSKFAPGDNISYAETITILIRSKTGSSPETFPGKWPDNYIKYAQLYNMMADITVKDWNASATKGDVIKLVYRNMPNSSTVTPELDPTPHPVPDSTPDSTPN